MDSEPPIPNHGGYRKLKSFQVAQWVYDLTVRFCDHYIDKRSRTHAASPATSPLPVHPAPSRSLTRTLPPSTCS